jgi:trypsin-like peptidase
MSPQQPEVDGARAEGLSTAQVEDFVDVLAMLSVRSIESLVSTINGGEAVLDAGDHIDDPKAFARAIVEALQQDNRLGALITRFRKVAGASSRYSTLIDFILRGGRLSDREGLQSFNDDFEPFFRVKELRENFDRISRAICIIGLGDPHNKLQGSGFLIGPDLVMTNYHVIEPYLKEDENGKIVESVSGDRIECFFDYMAEPTPRVPYAEGRHSYTCVKAARENWLVHARPIPMAGRQHERAYDYAVIRLSRGVGALPADTGGGMRRGWLNVPPSVDVINVGRRLIIYQHPRMAPQQIDVGKYEGQNGTESRVRYTVRTAGGSSGSAAIDTSGDLFALHAASTEIKIGGDDVNEGVRIDFIGDDLNENVPDWRAADEADPSQPYWSLNDDLEHSQPIIGRDDFRDNIRKVNGGDTSRVLVAWGPPGSGLRYSVKILRRTIGLLTPVIEFTPHELATYSPEQFLKATADMLNISVAQHKIPVALDEEDLPRWLYKLGGWLRDRLAEFARNDPSRMPVWFVLNVAVPAGERFLWADPLKEFIGAIAGAHERAVPIPQLRFLFLASKPEGIPVLGANPLWDDLSTYATSRDDYITCVKRAWASVDPKREVPWPFLDQIFELATEGKDVLQHRKILSEKVRKAVTAQLVERTP